jgi:DNA polymerase sigma
VDLTVDTRGLVEPENCHLGIRSTELIREWLNEINGLYSVLILLKHLFYRKGLSTTYKGGISPYCLLVMLKAYMRHAGLSDPSPSELLEGFLKFYGHEFDERKDGIDIRSPQPFYTR